MRIHKNCIDCNRSIYSKSEKEYICILTCTKTPNYVEGGFKYEGGKRCQIERQYGECGKDAKNFKPLRGD